MTVTLVFPPQIKNHPKEQYLSGARTSNIFFHPDYTVGTGITPVHAKWLADFTAGREFHPALKIYRLFGCAFIIVPENNLSIGL